MQVFRGREVGGGWLRPGKLVGQEALRTHYRVFSVRFKNVHSDRSYRCTQNGGHGCDRGIKLLPGRSEVNHSSGHAAPTAAVHSVRALR